MLTGQTRHRSDLNVETLIARLQARGVEQLREEDAIWVIVDGSDLRKPHATQMDHLQPVPSLAGAGTVPGYPTLNVLGVGQHRRGLLYHRLSSSQAPDFRSAPAEVRTAIRSVGTALAPLAADVTTICDSGFDDQALWGETWAQGMHLLCRVQHRERLVRSAPDAPRCHLEELADRLRPLAQIETELVVQKTGQPRPKLQPTTATLAATPVVVPYRWRPVPGGAVSGPAGWSRCSWRTWRASRGGC